MVEDQLMRDTWQVPGYDLRPKLPGLTIPTLVIVGKDDFIPVAVAEQIGRAISGAKLVTISECGHFAYLECAGDVRKAFDDFFLNGSVFGLPVATWAPVWLVYLAFESTVALQLWRCPSCKRRLGLDFDPTSCNGCGALFK